MSSETRITSVHIDKPPLNDTFIDFCNDDIPLDTVVISGGCSSGKTTLLSQLYDNPGICVSNSSDVIPMLFIDNNGDSEAKNHMSSKFIDTDKSNHFLNDYSFTNIQFIYNNDFETYGLVGNILLDRNDFSKSEKYFLTIIEAITFFGFNNCNNGVVLIDDAGDCLHTQHQHKLINILNKLQDIYGFQLVLTTYQVAFVKRYGTNSVRLLTKF